MLNHRLREQSQWKIWAERKVNHAGSWLAGIMGRRNKNVASVALANKNARIVWALLAHDREYASDYAAMT